MKLRFINEEANGELHSSNMKFQFSFIKITLRFTYSQITFSNETGDLFGIEIPDLHQKYIKSRLDIDYMREFEKEIQEAINEFAPDILERLLRSYKINLDSAQSKYDKCKNLYSKELIML
jgi:hypothetical protein